MVIYISTKFHENILDDIQDIERTRFSQQKNSKRHNSVKNEGGILVLTLWTSSDGG